MSDFIIRLHFIICLHLNGRISKTGERGSIFILNRLRAVRIRFPDCLFLRRGIRAVNGKGVFWTVLNNRWFLKPAGRSPNNEAPGVWVTEEAETSRRNCNCRVRTIVTIVGSVPVMSTIVMFWVGAPGVWVTEGAEKAAGYWTKTREGTHTHHQWKLG